MRAQHILDAVGSPDQVPALEALTDLINAMAAGEAPVTARALLAGASLHALAKKDGGIRPIAVGETLRRLTSKLVGTRAVDEAREYLQPLQCGVRCANGAEAVVHMTAQYMFRHSDDRSKAVLKIDFENAFNSVDRAVMLKACLAHAPSAAHWARWCYADSSDLYYGADVVASARGVQQGDNLGPLLYALAQQPLLEQLRDLRVQGRGLDVVTAYLDDVVLAGPTPVIREALRMIEVCSPAIGLAPCIGKCELVPLAGLGGDHALFDFPASLPVNTSGNFEVLGAPIGGAAFAAEYVRTKRVKKTQRLRDEVVNLEDAHAGYKILSQCLGACRLLYAMRTTRPDWLQEVAAEADAAVREAMEALLGRPLREEAWLQATLPIRLGGLGLRSAARHAPAAHLASVAETVGLCSQMDTAYVFEGLLPDSGVGTACAQLAAVVPEKAAGLSADPAAVPRQRVLSGWVDDALVAHLSRTLSVVGQARLRATASPHAGAWLTAQASPTLCLHMPSAEFVAAVRLRLGEAAFPTDSWCPKCDAVLDTMGLHAVECAAGGDRTTRHHSLRDFLYIFARKAGLHVEREQAGLLPNQPRRRPGDLVFPLWPGGVPIAVDVAVTSPFRQAVVAEAAKQTLVAAKSYEAHKLADRETATLCAAQGLRLMPMVAEVTGGWGPDAQTVVAFLARAAALRSGAPVALATNQLYEALAVRLQRANARAVLARMGPSLSSALATPSSSEAVLTSTGPLREDGLGGAGAGGSESDHG